MHTDERIAALMTDDTVFITPTGSRLYNLANEHSDFDYLQVRDDGRKSNAHSVVGELDVRVFSPQSLLDLATKKPSHTTAEAFFSPLKSYGSAADRWIPMLAAFRPAALATAANFKRTAIGSLQTGDKEFKRLRFALYLAWAAWELRAKGFYNPQLTDEHAAELTESARRFQLRYPHEERADAIAALFHSPHGLEH